MSIEQPIYMEEKKMNANRIGLMPRIIASIIDGLIVFIPAMILYMIFPAYLSTLLAYAAVLGITYLDVLNGATPGKQIMKLGIRQTDGAAASHEQLTKRYMVKALPSAVGLFAAIFGFIPYLGTFLMFLAFLFWLAYVIYNVSLVMKPSAQAYHDQYAGTAVYNVEELATAGNAPVAASAYGSVPEANAGFPPIR
jgi:uncharacterized RDD family membrane protein YckC